MFCLLLQVLVTSSLSPENVSYCSSCSVIKHASLYTVCNYYIWSDVMVANVFFCYDSGGNWYSRHINNLH